MMVLMSLEAEQADYPQNRPVPSGEGVAKIRTGSIMDTPYSLATPQDVMFEHCRPRKQSSACFNTHVLNYPPPKPVSFCTLPGVTAPLLQLPKLTGIICVCEYMFVNMCL